MIPRFCRRSCLGSGRADARRNALQLCARLSYSRPETCTGAGAHKHTLGAGALTHAVSLHRHANERIVLLAKNGYRDMLNTLSFRPRSELLSAPDRCSIIGKVISLIVLSLGGSWAESGWVLYDVSRENCKSRWVILGKELRE